MTRQEAIDKAMDIVAGAWMDEDSEYIRWCHANHISAPDEAYVGRYDKGISIHVYGDHVSLITNSGCDRFEFDN